MDLSRSRSHEDAATPPDARAAALQRLHGLARAVTGDLDLDRTLQSVCQGVVDGLGFREAVLNLVLPDGPLEVVACAGSASVRDALLGTRGSREAWDARLAGCDPVGEVLVDYAHRAPDQHGLHVWVQQEQEQASEDPLAWHPLDVLLAPLRTARSGLLGVLSLDAPVDGRRPTPEQLQLLEVYAAQASVAIENAQLHTALRAQHEEGAEALGRLSALVDSTPVAIVELDLQGRVRLWNPAAERIFGWSAQEVLGRRNPVLAEADQQSRLLDLRRLADGPELRVPARRLRRDGTVIDLEVTSSLLRDDEGRPFGYIGVYEDVTERLLLLEELRAAAQTDALTGLANRALFNERLTRTAASGSGAWVLLLDLDGFKAVNDTVGHAAGDRVLVEVARRTVALCRPRDLVARLGGDELVVLLEGGDDDGTAQALAARLVDVLAEPVQVGVASVSLGASVGLARLAATGSADDLLRDADIAMYAAKGAGKGQYRVFQPEMRAELLERASLVHDLRTALGAEDQLFVRWQPVVRVADVALIGLEALVRWQHPSHGELPPGVFMPLAEESGLVVEMGRQVLHTACRQLRTWQDTIPGTRHLQVGVNLSRVQVRSDVVATVRDVLRDTGVHPGHLVIELTEDVLLGDMDSAVEVLQQLRGLGVRLAVDHFGAGYSALALLKRLPVDVVKLDPSLLSGVEGDPSALALLDAVVGLVRRLGLTGVAEGVESPGQWRLLERLRCPAAQGFLLAHPLLAAEVPRLLEVGRPSSGTRRPG